MIPADMSIKFLNILLHWFYYSVMKH